MVESAVVPCEFKIGDQQIKRLHRNIEGIQKGRIGGI
jgi:hypothetical protein